VLEIVKNQSLQTKMGKEMGKETAQKKDGLTPPFPNRKNTLFYVDILSALVMLIPSIWASTLAILDAVSITKLSPLFKLLLIIDKLNNLLVGLYIACIDV
jgi:hypothetical protein